jgi:hypothetical protein
MLAPRAEETIHRTTSAQESWAVVLIGAIAP